jgi:hypothetical protein
VAGREDARADRGEIEVLNARRPRDDMSVSSGIMSSSAWLIASATSTSSQRCRRQTSQKIRRLAAVEYPPRWNTESTT